MLPLIEIQPVRSLASCTAWVFDLDGTLTLPVHDFEHIRRELGLAPGADILASIHASPLSEQPALRARLDELELLYAARAEGAEGVLPLLERLHGAGCALGILTRNSREIALRSLRAIKADQFFTADAVIGRDEARPKPDVQGIQILLDLWHKSPSEAVMVGDFRYDLEAGRAAGTATVHVDSRDRHWPELTDHRVASLSELARLLEQ